MVVPSCGWLCRTGFEVQQALADGGYLNSQGQLVQLDPVARRATVTGSASFTAKSLPAPGAAAASVSGQHPQQQGQQGQQQGLLRRPRCSIEVVEADGVTVAQALAVAYAGRVAREPALLNVGSARRPLAGHSGAQEENLHRRSSLRECTVDQAS